MKLLAFCIVAVLCLNEIKCDLEYVMSNVSISDVCDSRIKKCLWRCCPPGHYIRFKSCVPSETTVGLNVTVYNSQFEPTGISVEDAFQFAYGILNDTNFVQNAFNVHLFGELYLMEDGNLYIEQPNTFDRWILVTTDHFCLENTRNKNTIFQGELDLESEHSVENLEYALIVSIIFLLATLLPYCLVGELRDLNGAILVTFIILYTVPFVLMLMGRYFVYTATQCIIIALVYHFCYVSSFCWTNIMFYRIQAREEYCPRSSVRQYLQYCCYTVSLPLVLVAIVAAAEHVDLSHMPWFIKPHLIYKANYLFSTKESLVYFYVPLILLLLFNWGVCVKNLVNYHRKPRAIPRRVFTNDDSGVESPLNSPAKHVTLLILMTLRCTVHAMGMDCSGLVCRITVFMYFIINLCIGPLIFFIFVLNRNVLHIIKRKFIRPTSKPTRVLYENNENVTLN